MKLAVDFREERYNQDIDIFQDTHSNDVLPFLNEHILSTLIFFQKNN